MKIERFMKMLPVMFIVYSAWMFTLYGAVLSEGKEQTDTRYQEKAAVSAYAADSELQ